MLKKIVGITAILMVAGFYAFWSEEKPLGGQTFPASDALVVNKPNLNIEKTHSVIKASYPDTNKGTDSASTEQKKISEETEKEFLKLKIPQNFSSSPKERYQQIYSIYLTSSFYLNEVAAGNLSTNKEQLTKALRGLALYFREMESSDQPDSALALIEANYSSLFHEAIDELTPSDKDLIESALKLQSGEK
jgi:hypothetical protein